MSIESSDTDLDMKVERLKKKYLDKKKMVTPMVYLRAAVGTDDPPLTTLRGTEDDVKVQRPVKSRRRGCTYREMKCYNKALKELYQAISNHPQRLDSGQTGVGSENELSEEYTDSLDGTNIQITETDVTLPSNLIRTSSSEVTGATAWSRKQESERRTLGLPSQISRSPPGIRQVYEEMLLIYEKLQAERLHQQDWEVELLEREQQLQHRENLLLQHQSTINRLRGAEGSTHSRIQAMQEQHRQEISELNCALKEKTKENRRLKSSFDTMKELNDSMKKQFNEVSEQNARLEQQARKAQARLENLQRKYEYAMAQRGRENIAPKPHDPKLSKPEKPLVTNKATKRSTSVGNLKLLALLLDWVLDSQLVQTGPEHVVADPIQYSDAATTSLPEKCSKVLPMLAEQLQQASALEPSLVLPLLRLSYWTLRQLDLHPQHTPLTSTMRRLGEEVFRGSGDPGAPGRGNRSCPLYKSPCLHTRFLSALIILNTISQADILAQALDVLHGAVRTEDGQVLFLRYQALSAILALLRGGSPGLLTPAVDVLLQMSTESRFLEMFLDACSTDDFFRCVSLLLRNPRIDLTLVEKLTVLLQKLSGIRKNKRLFEVFSLHLLLQEMYRTADPTHTFLCINLSSILFNLSMLTRS
ncbi:coiled-coil domain-containing protein 138 [Chanos chanos]|uniref:Coiled-coil domain-containing protein 138 n=1 Tax=Chanos chanos TaxID=29144 RepID=A0A6J2WGG0_CHACN|nr:coiled-coil domain-containing protein 138 [Chanos chanos]